MSEREAAAAAVQAQAAAVEQAKRAVSPPTCVEADAARLQQHAEAQALAHAAAVRAAAAVPTVYLVHEREVPIHPISNALPESLFVAAVTHPKLGPNAFASNVPGNLSTYTFHDEAAYLSHYREALFGITRKKTGWDCGRHLEIMASGAVPFFLDLEQLPARTLALYPRDAIAAAMALPGVSVDRSRGTSGRGGERWYLERDRFRVDREVFDETAYLRLAAEILAHARTHLSSRGMASFVLHTLGLTPDVASPILFITHCSDDFTGDSLLHGLQLLVGAVRVTDVAFDTDGGFQHPWCKESDRHQRAKPSLRTRREQQQQASEQEQQARELQASEPQASEAASAGHTRFSIHGKHTDDHAGLSRDHLPARIAAREFGLIVFGSASRTVGGLLGAAAAAGYPRRHIALVYGEDLPYPLDVGWPMEGVQRPASVAPTVPSIAEAARVGVIFQRELYDEPALVPHTQQTLMIPGVADVAERGWRAMRRPLP